MATAKGIVKPKSTWAVDSPLMLRARAIGRLVDMHVPAIRAGSSDDDFESDAESPEMASKPRTRTPKAAASGPASPAAGSSESAAAGHAPAGEPAASSSSVASGKPAEDAEFSPKGMSESVRLAVLLTDLRQQHGDSHPDVAVCRSQLLAARIQSEREGGELIPDSEIAEVQNLVAAVKHTDLYKIAVPLLTRYIGPEKHIAEMTPTAGKWLLIHLYLAALKFSKETIAAALAKCGAGEVEDLNRAHATAFVDSLRKRYATPAAA
jgi:hypothetical protein